MVLRYTLYTQIKVSSVVKKPTAHENKNTVHT